MRDDRLDRLIDDARRASPPPDAPAEEMWRDIESRAFAGRQGRPSLNRRWIATAGMAATLALGFALGRGTAPEAPARLTSAPATPTLPPSGVARPYERTTSTLLGETVVLLSALPNDGGNTVSNRRFAAEATQLLTTTRLLLDSQASTDPRIRTLLEDLELVLAQVAHIREGRTGTELELISEAMAEHELVPRIRTLAAQLAASAD